MAATRKPKPRKIRAWALQMQPGDPITMIAAGRPFDPSLAIYSRRATARKMRDQIADERVIPVTITFGH